MKVRVVSINKETNNKALRVEQVLSTKVEELGKSLGAYLSRILVINSCVFLHPKDVFESSILHLLSLEPLEH